MFHGFKECQLDMVEIKAQLKVTNQATIDLFIVIYPMALQEIL
jgi:hypothetical protein|tara:strand:- start:3678 stop:3806 length:129 start_codon:yes stop_codon:yes gene_type:complete